MQDWHDIINCFCKSVQASAIKDGSNLIIISPREITEQELAALKNGIPSELILKIVVGPQPSIMLVVEEALIYFHIIYNVIIDMKARKFVLEVNNSYDIDNPVWIMIGELIRMDTFFKSWELILNGKSHVFDFNVAKEIANHKETTILTKDTLTDLQIALENCNDVNDFINQI